MRNIEQCEGQSSENLQDVTIVVAINKENKLSGVKTCMYVVIESCIINDVKGMEF